MPDPIAPPGGRVMRRRLAAVFVAAIPSLGVAAPQPGWTVMADCAAAYRANARIDDKTRPPSMRAMISGQAEDYVRAAVQTYRKRTKVSQGKAEQSVEAYVARATAKLSRQPRAEDEQKIEACPQAPDRP